MRAWNSAWRWRKRGDLSSVRCARPTRAARGWRVGCGRSGRRACARLPRPGWARRSQWNRAHQAGSKVRALKAEGFKFADGCVEAGDDLRFAIVEKAVSDGCEAREGGLRGGLGGREGTARSGASSRSRKSQPMVSKDSRKVRAAAPVAAAERGAITGEAAECGGHAHGAARVRADGGDRGALKHAGDCAAG